MTVSVNSNRKKISLCIENINYLSMFYVQRNFKGIFISTFKSYIENLCFFIEINFTTVWK